MPFQPSKSRSYKPCVIRCNPAVAEDLARSHTQRHLLFAEHAPRMLRSTSESFRFSYSRDLRFVACHGLLQPPRPGVQPFQLLVHHVNLRPEILVAQLLARRDTHIAVWVQRAAQRYDLRLCRRPAQPGYVGVIRLPAEDLLQIHLRLLATHGQVARIRPPRTNLWEKFAS